MIFPQSLIYIIAIINFAIAAPVFTSGCNGHNGTSSDFICRTRPDTKLHDDDIFISLPDTIVGIDPIYNYEPPSNSGY